MQTRKIPADVTLDFMPGVQFSAFTREVNGVERKLLSGTGSSTAQDFYGSVIDAGCQVKMHAKLTALAAKFPGGGLTAFLNHKYNVPEDVLGSFTSASLATRTSDGTDGIAGGEAGSDYIDLDMECLIDESNPRALAAWNQVKSGIRLGWSIGAYFLDAHYASEDPSDPGYWDLIVTDIELLEISLCGIPANQRAWCRSKEDMSAKVVGIAEKIARDAELRSHGDRVPIERMLNIRELTRRSVVEHDSDETIEQRALAVEFRKFATEPSEELTASDRELLEAAAVLLEKRVDEGTEGNTALIASAVGHIARAVGHGVCARSASHMARALECLSNVIGADGGTATPAEEALKLAAAGDCFNVRDVEGVLTFEKLDAPIVPKETDQIAADVEKLAPPPGSVIVIKSDGVSPEMLKSLAESFHANGGDSSVMFFSLGKRDAATIEATSTAAMEELVELEAKVEKLTGDISTLDAKIIADTATLDESITAKKAELHDLTILCADESTRVGEAQTQLDTLKVDLAKATTDRDALLASIEEKKLERAGRVTQTSVVMTTLASEGNTEVQADFYNMSQADKDAAMAKQVSGKTLPPAGRDTAL